MTVCVKCKCERSNTQLTFHHVGTTGQGMKRYDAVCNECSKRIDVTSNMVEREPGCDDDLVTEW